MAADISALLEEVHHCCLSKRNKTWLQHLVFYASLYLGRSYVNVGHTLNATSNIVRRDSRLPWGWLCLRPTNPLTFSEPVFFLVEDRPCRESQRDKQTLLCSPGLSWDSGVSAPKDRSTRDICLPRLCRAVVKKQKLCAFSFFFFLPGALSFTAFFFRTSCSHLSRRIKRMILIQSFKQRVLLALYIAGWWERVWKGFFFFFFNCTFLEIEMRSNQQMVVWRALAMIDCYRKREPV